MSNDIVAAFKALSLHGMAGAWPEMLGTARTPMATQIPPLVATPNSPTLIAA